MMLLRRYLQFGVFSSAATALTNVAWSVGDPYARLKPSRSPKVYGACLAAKTMAAGVAWWSVPFYLCRNPVGYFCVGEGAADVLENNQILPEHLRKKWLSELHRAFDKS